MRVLVAIHFAGEVEKESYVATPLTKAIAKPVLEAGLRSCHDLSSLVQMQMHEYLREHGYSCPMDETDCAFQWTFKTKDRYFDYIHRNPQNLKDFNTFLSGIRDTRNHWTDWYPVEERLLQRFSGKEILLVDVGGGKGHDLERFMAKHPMSKGNLVLQDLPGVIDDIASFSEGIQSMAHDIFQPQPIKGPEQRDGILPDSELKTLGHPSYSCFITQDDNPTIAGYKNHWSKLPTADWPEVDDHNDNGASTKV
ncbi:MAG: hypothetical protein Q9165_002408 [Trypethelium subeluteriae]